MTIVVERDVEGLQLAVRELFEESFHRESGALTMAGASPEQRARVEAGLPQLTLSPGYYSRARYLLQLASWLEAGCNYSTPLQQAEVEGLAAIARARRSFEIDHPECGQCGTRQMNAFLSECRKCHVKFARAA